MSAVIVWVVGLVWITYTQLRPVVAATLNELEADRHKSSWTVQTPVLSYVALGLGLVLTARRLSEQSASSAALVVLALGLVIAAVLAVARAVTVRLSVGAAEIVRVGSWFTITLWAVAACVHLVAEYIAVHVDDLTNLDLPTVLLFLGMSLTVQDLVVRRRVIQLENTNIDGTRSQR